MRKNLTFKAKYFALLLFLCSVFALGQQHYYVSVSTGSDTNNGLTWQTAFKTMDKAMTVVSAQGSDANVYFAQGDYLVGDHEFDGSYMVNLFGGFPVPNASTSPQDVCNPNTDLYETSFEGTANTGVFTLRGTGG